MDPADLKTDPIDEWLAAGEWAGEAGRPLVTLSYAQSLDGSIAARRGEPMALSGPQSQKLTHKLRAAHDALLVGIGTILSDDPQLNVRLVEGGDPQVVILDSRLRFPPTAKLMSQGRRPIVFCTALASSQTQDALAAAGVQVERQAANNSDRIDLPPMLERLNTLGVRRLMVEGGGEVISSFLSAGLVDRLAITIAPVFVSGYKPIPSPVRSNLNGLAAEKYGKDIVIWGDIQRT
ncbi:MAG: RibD family protein [Anaerolineales bacterium]